MRKRITFRKLGVKTSHRKAMFRNMATSLIKHERIMTTYANAMELRRVAEKLVTRAKKRTETQRHIAKDYVREAPAFVKLWEILGPRHEGRAGGYTRVMKLQKPRRGDSAQMAYIEFVDRDGELRKAKPGIIREQPPHTRTAYQLMLELAKGYVPNESEVIVRHKQGAENPNQVERREKEALATKLKAEKAAQKFAFDAGEGKGKRARRMKEKVEAQKAGKTGSAAGAAANAKKAAGKK